MSGTDIGYVGTVRYAKSGTDIGSAARYSGVCTALDETGRAVLSCAASGPDLRYAATRAGSVKNSGPRVCMPG
eukprot:29539-Rhodomonas_salina.3